MEACYGGTDVMERSCAVARGIDINRRAISDFSFFYPVARRNERPFIFYPPSSGLARFYSPLRTYRYDDLSSFITPPRP
jgi:hypothetical protein